MQTFVFEEGSGGLGDRGTVICTQKQDLGKKGAWG